MKWNIGNVEIQNKIVLAPMADISNSAYRRIIKEMGVGLLFAEMINNKSLVQENEKTINLLKMNECERPIVQQIFGNDEESFVIAAKKVMEIMNPDIIDINMGCPVPKVAIRAQAGSALLKDINKIKSIVSSVVKSVSVHVTVKIRSGWDEKSINAVEVAKACEESGAKAITIHARTRSQGYSGKADWNIIKSVKKNVSIPVIGNGDVTSCYLAKQMLDETGCDAVMIGRGVLGNPWLIKECVEYLETGKNPDLVSNEDRLRMLKKHFKYLLEDKGEKVALLEIRNNALWYVKGLPNSKEIKPQIIKCKTSDELFTLIDNYLL